MKGIKDIKDLASDAFVTLVGGLAFGGFGFVLVWMTNFMLSLI